LNARQLASEQRPASLGISSGLSGHEQVISRKNHTNPVHLMKPNPSNRLFAGAIRHRMLAAIACSFTFAPAIQAQTLYWDTNQDEAGSGDAGGVWESDSWTTDPSGLTAPTGAWIDGRSAVFSAGTTGTGAWTVTVNGTVTTPSILMKESGAKTISGGTINIGGGAINTAAAGNGNLVTISSVLSGSGGLTVTAHGDLSDSGGGVGGMLALSGANTFTGDLTINGGLIRANSGFGAAGNKLILDGGGILDNNLNLNITRNIEIPAGKTGFYRTFGGVSTGKLSGAFTGSGTLRLTDGGTRTIDGDGSAFAGTLWNGIGTMVLGSNNWSGTTVRQHDNTNTFRISAAGDTSIKSLISDRDVIVPIGSRLNIVDGTYTTVGAGASLNGFWAQGTTAGVAGATGEITSSSGTLTLTNGAATGNLTTTDNQIRLKITNFGSGPNPDLAVVKNNQNVLVFDQANTYSGGTTLNGGRLNANNVSAFGTGTVTVNSGAQAYLLAAGIFPNNFVINGIGVPEGSDNLGAIRFQGNTLSGNVNVASDSRMVAYGTTGTLSGALTGSANLDLNLAASPGTLSFTGNTSGYTGTMTLNAGTLNVGSLGGDLTISAGAANLSGAVSGAITVAGGTVLSLDNGAQIGSPVLTSGNVRTINVNAGATVSGNLLTAYVDADAVVNIAGNVTGNVLIDDNSSLGLRGGTIGGNLSSGYDANSNIAWNLLAPLTVTGNLTTLGTQTVALLNNPTPGSSATVVTYGGTFSGNIADFALANSANYRSVTFQNTGGAITVSTGTGVRTWVGAHATDPTFWDAVTPNWVEGDNLFFNGDSVVFDDTAIGTTVAMQGTLLPFAVSFNNSTKDFSVGGPGLLSGSTGITKTGTGTLTLGAANTFTGAVNVNGGVLNLGSQQGLGQNSGVTVASGARVNLNGQTPGALGAAYRYAWTIAGDGGDGAGGVGAIANTGGDVFGNSGVFNLTLSGDAEIGSNNGRFDIGLGGGAIHGGGFTLTKTGSNQIVIRPSTATDVNYVVNQGTLTFEDSDAGSGSNAITVNGTARLSTWGARTLANAVTLNSGTTLANEGGGTGTWTGTLTAAGPVTFNTGGNLVISGALAGSGNITRTGTNTLFLQANGSAFSGKINSTSGGTLRIQSNASLGTATGADVLTLGGGVTVQGGTAALQGSASIGSATQGITTTGNVTLGVGAGNTLTFDGAISGTTEGVLEKANNTGAAVFNRSVNLLGSINANAGSMTFNGDLTLGATGSSYRTGTGLVNNFNCPNLALSGGMQFWLGTTNINIGTGTTTSFRMQEGSNNPHTVNHTAGDLTVTGDIRLGHWGGSTANVYNISGGSLNQPDTVTSPTNEAQANLFIGIDGIGNLNISGTGVVNTSSLVVNGRGGTTEDTVNLTGGRLNIGKWGIRNPGTAIVNLGGGTLGAWADWTSSTPMTLTGTNGNVKVNTLDSVDGTTPRTVTLTGVLSGSGGLIKEGAGSLVLSASNSFTGTAEVVDGSLFLNSGAASAATVRTSPGGTLRTGTPGVVGTAGILTLDMAGGNTTFRQGSTSDLVNAGTLNVTSPSTISIIPTRQLLPGEEFDLIAYTGTIGGLGSAGISLNPIANPHYSAALDFSEDGYIKVDILSADTITWKGNVNGTWDVDTSSNWVLDSDGVTASKFYAFDAVTFDDSSANTAVTLVGTINPASVEVNAAQDYSFSGSGISGSSGLVKTGEGTLTLLNNNSYLGASSITGGSVIVGNGGTTGTLGGSGNITLSGSTLTFNRSDAQTLARTIIGSNGTLVKNGNATLTMSAGANTCDIVVNGGTLAARGGGFSAAFAAERLITVNAGATLDTVTHSMGSVVGGGGEVPRVDLVGGAWQVNNEQYLRELTMTAGSTTGAGDIRTLGGSVFTVNAAATSSTIASGISLFNALNLSVADGAAAADLLISGTISNSGSITKSGDGTLVTTGNNTYTGATTISDGVLQIGNGGTTGNLGTGAITNNASLIIHRSDSVTIPNVISGSGSLTKNGAATLTLGAVNTYSGNTFVNAGTLSLPSAAGMRFVPTSNGTSNQITGSGGVELSGTFTIDLSGANLTNGNSWTLVDVASLSSEVFLSSFSVAGFTETANVHTLVDGDNTWTFSEATGVLSLTVTGSDYDTWAVNLTGGPGDDDDGDGLSNFQEYAFGLDPLNGSSVSPITVPINPATGTFSYTRRNPALTELNYAIQTSTTLAVGDWTTDLGAIQSVVSTVGDVQTVQVTLTGALLTEPKIFVRVEASK
jgi:fibronectin-binding autotransporter adhesin